MAALGKKCPWLPSDSQLAGPPHEKNPCTVLAGADSSEATLRSVAGGELE